MRLSSTKRSTLPASSARGRDLISLSELFGGSTSDELLGQFINNPKAPLDTSCTSMVYPVDFDPTTTNNKLISKETFGTDDMWE